MVIQATRRIRPLGGNHSFQERMARNLEIRLWHKLTRLERRLHGQPGEGEFQTVRTEAISLLRAQRPHDAAAILRGYYERMQLVAVHGPELFDFERSSLVAAKRYDEKRRGPVPSIQTEEQWRIVMQALETNKISIEYLSPLIGDSLAKTICRRFRFFESRESLRLGGIYALATATSPDNIAVLTQLIKHLASTQRKLHQGTGTGSEWGDGQDIDYTLSHQMDRSRVQIFAVIAQKLLENGSITAFDLLVRSIQMLPLVDKQTIMRDDHGCVSYYMYVLFNTLPPGSVIKRSVSRRILHITEQSTAACAKILSTARGTEEFAEGLKAAIHLSRLCTYLGMFFTRIWRIYKTDKRALALLDRVTKQFEAIAQFTQGTTAEGLREIGSLLKQLAVLLEDYRVKNFTAEEKRVLERLNALWQIILGEEVPSGFPLMLNS